MKSRCFAAGVGVGLVAGMLLAAHADRELLEELAAANRSLAEVAEAQDRVIREAEPIVAAALGRPPWSWVPVPVQDGRR